MVSGETHYVWGQRYLLDVSRTGRHHIELDHHTLWLVAPRGADMASRRRVLDRWYRKQLTDALPPLLDKWLPIVGEQPSRVEIRRMRTKWGSCSSHNRQIRLNPELATLHPRCLEYVLVHELAHLIERTHSRGFHALLDDFLPAWRSIRDELNEHPIPYSLWGPGSHGDVD
jgi:predicted metal-dependent hydrolase